MIVMAKKKQDPSPTPPDRHSSGYMVRLPEVFRERLRLLTRTTRRSMTVEIQMMLEAALREKGLWTDEDSASLL